MAESSLTRKLNLKPDDRAALVKSPQGYTQALRPLPDGVLLSHTLQGSIDWIQAFVRSRAELEKVLPRLVRSLKPVSLLWISFRKGSSGIQTDLTRDKGWDILGGVGLTWITLVSVDEVWSAFAFRPFKPGENQTSHPGRDRGRE
jgi:hypothetical protein